MGKVVKLVDGYLVYDGMLSSQEIATIDEILKTLQEEIPIVEADLAEEYGKSVWYKYYLGQFLSDLLEKYNISISERRLFWDEIKHFATTEDRKRDEGKNSAKRSFYEQCYVLSQIDKNTVDKLAWRQWQSILDRGIIREDDRLFKWIGTLEQKVKGDEWREFEKALNLFLKNKDLSVFEDEELFNLYTSIYNSGKIWLECINTFAKEHPKSAKLESKSKTKWSKKYYSLCFAKKKELRIPTLTEEICRSAFNELFY